LPNARFQKLFSAEEANQLIPRLDLLVRRLQMQANSLRAKIREIAERDSTILGLDLAEVVKRYPELRPFASAMAEVAGEIESLGCLLKDIDQGLIDFPGKVEEETVFLCWPFGEPHIVAWHTLDSGFAQRQPLPGAPKLYLN
jgi:hypothetical protein